MRKRGWLISGQRGFAGWRYRDIFAEVVGRRYLGKAAVSARGGVGALLERCIRCLRAKIRGAS